MSWKLNRSEFLLRGEFTKLVVPSVTALHPFCDVVKMAAPLVITDELGFLRAAISAYGFGVSKGDNCLCALVDFQDNTSWRIAEFEEFIKAISKAVEPGSYIEFETDRGDLVRYVFLHDSVERWTKPHILYAQKEAI